MNKLTPKAEYTRNFIIERSAELFNKKGYAGTSMSDITTATGLTKGSIYGNFESKEAVALAVFDHNYARISRSTDEQVAQAETFHDKLMVYAKVYKNIAKNLGTRDGCAILNTAVEADDTNPLLKDKAAKAVLRWEEKICRLINQGIAAGEFKADVNIRQTALSIVALIEGGVMIAKVTGDISSMDNVLKTVELLIDQLKK